MKTSLITRLIPSYLLILLLTTVSITAVSLRVIRTYQNEQVRTEMLTAARLVASRFAIESADWSTLPFQAACLAAANASPYRFTIIAADGQPLGDSLADPAGMDNHADRPEVRDALAGDAGIAMHYSPTLRRDMLYVGVPVVQGAELRGVVRVGIDVAELGDPGRRLPGGLALGAGLIALVAIAVSLVVARGIRTSLFQVMDGVRAMAGGDLHRRLPELAIREFDSLGRTINSMADQLSDRIDTVTRQRDEQESLIGCMAEGVLAVDGERRVLIMNRAAESLFNVDAGEARGRAIEEVIRNADLHRLVREILTRQVQVEGEVYMPVDERYLQVNGSLLRGVHNGPRGAVLVLNDVTRLRKLETMRRDFVANVSHELKTPITSIKGFAETLLDGEHDPETLKRFLERIGKQADRLHALIEDILALSRVEHAQERGEVALERGAVAPVLHAAVKACEAAAAARQTVLDVQAPEGLVARINAPLLEQAVMNLIENAVKYGGERQTVQIRAGAEHGACRIDVQDQGPGIPRAHWPRLFERFYRVDQSRNRAQGGTGLGLAIVKHVALAHGGQVQVHSEQGQGSTFSILLPLVP